jgi:hypothetical protein
MGEASVSMRDVRAWSISDQIKYHAARFAFAHRHETCPRNAEIGGRHERITWGQWFELRFGTKLDDYQQQLTENDYALGETAGKDRQPDSIAR